MRLTENMTVADLAKLLGITKQGVHKRIRAAGVTPRTYGTAMLLTKSQAKKIIDAGKK